MSLVVNYQEKHESAMKVKQILQTLDLRYPRA